MYFFRDEGGPREGTERSIGYRRHTLHLQRREDGHLTVSPLSAASGLLDELEDSFYSAPTDHIPFPAQEPPVFTWRGEADGVKLELWPEAELRVQSAYIEGYEVKDLHLNEFGASIHTDAPDLDAQFTSVEGIMRICLTNTTGTHKSLTLNVTQNWGESRSALDGPASQEGSSPGFLSSMFWGQPRDSNYTGYDVVELGLELAPGETQILYYGGRGKGYANRIPAADCVMADWLEAVYTDSQGNEVPIPLEREVHLD